MFERNSNRNAKQVMRLTKAAQLQKESSSADVRIVALINERSSSLVTDTVTSLSQTKAPDLEHPAPATPQKACTLLRSQRVTFAAGTRFSS
jgi:hypothetical protein